MKKFGALVSAGAVSLAMAGAVLIAPSASAATLCGYPPVPCADGATNPGIPQTVGGAGSGAIIVSETVASKTPVDQFKEPGTSIGEAPKQEVAAGKTVKIGMTVQANTKVTLKVKINGVYQELGSSTSNSNGNVVVPALRFTKPGTYTVVAVDPKTGATSYVKIVVPKKR